MVDTIRDKSTLLTLLADNVNGDISAQDVRDMLVSLHGVYGAIYVTGGVTEQTGISGTPVKITGFAADGISSGTTPAHANDQITVGVAGDYKISAQLSFSGSASKTFLFEIRVDDITTVYTFERKLGAGGDIGSGSMVGLLTLAANAVVSVYVSSSDGGTSITIGDGQLIVEKVG